MNKVKITQAGFLGVLASVVSTRQTLGDTHDALQHLADSNQEVFQDPGHAKTCYGIPCSPTCDESVIEQNLEALAALNIVQVEGIAPFQCVGYCVNDTPAGVQSDKCEKAEALKKLVQLAAKLAVPPKH